MPEVIRGGGALVVSTSLLLLTLAFWKARIIDSAHIEVLTAGGWDIFISHYPKIEFGFGSLRSGDLPLWNPYQLCGVPFLAIPHVGLLYPGNLIYLFFDTGIGTEISYVLHLFLAGLSMFYLARTVGLSGKSALASSLTFMWSGWMSFYANQPYIISGMCWLPLTVLLVDFVISGRKFSRIGLILAIGFQILNGTLEFFMYNMIVSGLYSALRLLQLGRAEGWQTGLRRAGLLLACVVAGTLIVSAQLVPSLELVELSVRGATHLTLGQTQVGGVVSPEDFVTDTLRLTGMVNVGLLPLIGLALGSNRGHRGIWVLFACLVCISAGLTFGGKLYELYYESPIGGIFRRPHKLLHIYAFSQALIGGIALAKLEALSILERRILWRRWAWIASLAGLAGGTLWLLSEGSSNTGLGGSLLLLLVFGLLRSARIRSLVLVALLLLHAASLFFGSSQRFFRPASRPDAFHQFDDLLEELRELSGNQRVYLEQHLFGQPGLMQRQGMLKRLHVTGEYEPLVMQRYADFFDRVAPRRSHRAPFTGNYVLDATSNWSLMDLTSTRYYVAVERLKLDKYLASQKDAFSLTRDGTLRVYERLNPLPRSYFVPTVRLSDNPEDTLSILESPEFDPFQEAVLEVRPEERIPLDRMEKSSGKVKVVELDPDRIVLEVRASGPGFVVVTDAFYPGWQATADGTEIPIYRANYLFRAMPVGAGSTQIVMEYRPRSFWLGVAISSAVLALLVAVGIVMKSRATGRPGGEAGVAFHGPEGSRESI